MIKTQRLDTLIGEKRAEAHRAGECYIANVRCFLTSREERYRQDCAHALARWIEMMRACVAEWDATRVNSTPGGPCIPE